MDLSHNAVARTRRAANPPLAPRRRVGTGEGRNFNCARRYSRGKMDISQGVQKKCVGGGEGKGKIKKGGGFNVPRKTSSQRLGIKRITVSLGGEDEGKEGDFGDCGWKRAIAASQG